MNSRLSYKSSDMGLEISEEVININRLLIIFLKANPSNIFPTKILFQPLSFHNPSIPQNK